MVSFVIIESENLKTNSLNGLAIDNRGTGVFLIKVERVVVSVKRKETFKTKVINVFNYSTWAKRGRNHFSVKQTSEGRFMRDH